ncbi:nitroreductase family protein [Pseudidiomarina sp. YC-516-91]|uniref:nitroreductase family protein n=1 Tax=Pseudidiomarina salilacus TaxID=3384452 RepID=UPI00398469F5
MKPREIAKKIIPAKLVHRLREYGASFDRRFIKLFAGTRFTSALYYLLFSREFGREQQAVLKGRLAYWQSLKNIERTCALLRRNTHRLEKGLIMRPRRPSFASDYIGETVSCFRDAAIAQTLNEAELQWAYDVLDEYFNCVTDTPKIAVARKVWTELHNKLPLTIKRTDAVPYPHETLPPCDITPEQLHVLFQRRRSVRWYQPQQVPLDEVHRAMSMASLAPSACNRQPFEFYVVQEPKRAAKIANMAGGTVGFAEQISNLIVVVGDLKAYPAERDRHCIYIDASLASMQLMLAFETMGIATCPINWPDIEFREKLLEQELGLTGEQRPVMLIAFGYADPTGGIPYSAKKSSTILGRFLDHDSH